MGRDGATEMHKTGTPIQPMHALPTCSLQRKGTGTFADIHIEEQIRRCHCGSGILVPRSPKQPSGFHHFEQSVEKMWNEEGEPIEKAPNAMMILQMPVKEPVQTGDMIRKKK